VFIGELYECLLALYKIQILFRGVCSRRFRIVVIHTAYAVGVDAGRIQGFSPAAAWKKPAFALVLAVKLPKPTQKNGVSIDFAAKPQNQTN
jgi:hypothetical protein